MKNIAVIGVGYVGLVTAAAFSDLGNRVVALDINEEKIARLKQGIMPIYEPGLQEMVERNVRAGRLSFSTSYEETLKDAEFVFICVGTPEGVDGEADLQYVRMAAESIARLMDHPLIVINKLGCRHCQPAQAERYALLGGLKPRVPSGGLGYRRLFGARSRGARLARPCRRREGRPDIPAATCAYRHH